MALLQRLDPPAHLSDFDDMPGMREAWHTLVSRMFDSSIDSERPVVRRHDGSAGTIQFYNPSAYDPGDALVEQAVIWNAFPKELLRRFGRERALVEADRLWPLSGYRDPSPGRYDPLYPELAGDRPKGVARDVFYRPCVEYCEWHVDRDPTNGAIRRVTFSSEPPEYWSAMFGETIDPSVDDASARPPVSFPGSREYVLHLYRTLVSPDVKLEDLLVQKAFIGAQSERFAVGHYNPYNKWNTTHGIAHLCAPPNSLGAEIKLGADATVLYAGANKESVVHPDALICCAGFGGVNRNSDPTIGATVNALARLGAMVTLVNPVGLYMDHIDTSGWNLPNGIEPSDCVRVVRGSARMIERLVVEAPEDSGVTLSDLTIGGEPLRYGGQIAECISVKLVGAAARIGSVTDNAAASCVVRGYLDPYYPNELIAPLIGSTPPHGYVPAFELEGGTQAGGAEVPTLREARAARNPIAMRGAK